MEVIKILHILVIIHTFIFSSVYKFTGCMQLQLISIQCLFLSVSVYYCLVYHCRGLMSLRSHCPALCHSYYYINVLTGKMQTRKSVISQSSVIDHFCFPQCQMRVKLAEP